jgi:DNA-binding SARP family transcriptional activator
MTTTIVQEFDRLAQSVNASLTTHRQQLQREQEQIKCLTQLLNSCLDSSLDDHCISAINRLIELLDRHQQSATQVYDVLNTLTQAKDVRDLTIDSQGEIATCLKVELGELAQRLGIDRLTKLSTAAHNAADWSKLMAAYPDPDGYQWQLPPSKRGFYHKTHLQVVGTKTVKLVPGSSLN